MTDELGQLQETTFAAATGATASSFPPERRLTGDELADYLDRRAFATIATTRPDGRPHAALSSFERRGTSFWLPTVASAVRARNVGAEPWAALVVSEGDHDRHVAVIVEGPAAVRALGEAPDEVRAALPGDWIDCWLELSATRVLSYAAEGALG